MAIQYLNEWEANHNDWLTLPLTHWPQSKQMLVMTSLNQTLIQMFNERESWILDMNKKIHWLNHLTLWRKEKWISVMSEMIHCLKCWFKYLNLGHDQKRFTDSYVKISDSNINLNTIRVKLLIESLMEHWFTEWREKWNICPKITKMNHLLKHWFVKCHMKESWERPRKFTDMPNVIGENHGHNWKESLIQTLITGRNFLLTEKLIRWMKENRISATTVKDSLIQMLILWKGKEEISANILKDSVTRMTRIRFGTHEHTNTTSQKCKETQTDKDKIET